MGFEYYGNNDWRDYLAHFGVKGMKWGKRKKKSDQSYLRELDTVGTISFNGPKPKQVYSHSVTSKAKRTYSKFAQSGRGDYQLSASRHFKNQSKVRKLLAGSYYRDVKSPAVTTRSDANDTALKSNMYLDSYYNRKTIGGMIDRTTSRGKGRYKKAKKKVSNIISKLQKRKSRR